MTPYKEKAIQLVLRFDKVDNDFGDPTSFNQDKEFALIVVDEILLREKDILVRKQNTWGRFEWEQVKQEIEKLDLGDIPY